MVLAVPAAASAHTVNKQQCKRVASARSETVGEWRSAYKACRQRAKQHRVRHSCRRGRRPVVLRGSITIKGVRKVGVKRRRNITRALRLARKMKAPRSHMVALVAAMTQEASGHNKPLGHGTSVGILQLIDEHGSVAWRMKVENSAGWFLRGARRLDPHGRARLATTRRGWGLIQRVQRSGHPSLYNQWIPEASRTVRVFLGPCST